MPLIFVMLLHYVYTLHSVFESGDIGRNPSFGSMAATVGVYVGGKRERKKMEADGTFTTPKQEGEHTESEKEQRQKTKESLSLIYYYVQCRFFGVGSCWQHMPKNPSGVSDR